MNATSTNNQRIRNRFPFKAMAVALMAAYGSAAMAAGEPSIRKIFTAPAGYDEITAMATFNGALYVGVDSKLFRINDAGCRLQEEVTPSQFSVSFDSIVQFNGALYAAEPNGSIHRSSDGRHWQQVRTSGFAWGVWGSEMVVFNGHLYLVVNSNIDRTSDGREWTPVVGGDTSKLPASGQGARVTVFEGNLYAGVYTADGGHQIWRSGDGRHWSLDGEQDSGYGIAELKPFNNHVYAVETGYTQLHRRDGDFNAYAATYNAGGLDATYGVYNNSGPAAYAPMPGYTPMPAGGLAGAAEVTADNWHPLEIPAFEDRTDAGELAEHNGRFYLSAYTDDPGSTPFLYSSRDGKGWQAVGDGSWGLSGTVAAGAMASWNSKLYVGMSYHGDSAAVYEYVEAGGELSGCVATSIDFAPAPWRGW